VCSSDLERVGIDLSGRVITIISLDVDIDRSERVIIYSLTRASISLILEVLT